MYHTGGSHIWRQETRSLHGAAGNGVTLPDANGIADFRADVTEQSIEQVVQEAGQANPEQANPRVVKFKLSRKSTHD